MRSSAYGTVTAGALLVLGLAVSPANADTLRRSIDLEEFPRAKLTFDNGDGEKQSIGNRPLKINIRHESKKLKDALCDESGLTNIKRTAKGITIGFSIKVNADGGPLTLTDSAICDSVKRRGSMDLACSVEDDGGQFTLAIETNSDFCPGFDMIIEAGDSVRIGIGEGPDGGPADAPNVMLKAPPSVDLVLPLEK
jgi:hypothetical protein